MEGKLQEQIAFYLTGRRGTSCLEAIDENYRPALVARYRDLSELRYDFPLVLDNSQSPEKRVRSLSAMVDDAVAGLDGDPDRDRVARHGYRVERELRRQFAANGAGDFAALWNIAVSRLAGEDPHVKESADRLFAAFQASGDIVDAGSALAPAVIRHIWNGIQARKADAFREKAERMLLKLHGILEAEVVGSPIGRSPERLRAGVGTPFAAKFNFEALSQILLEAKPSVQLSNERRRRIRDLIEVLEQQRFYPLVTFGPKPFNFAFERCADASQAYRERYAQAVELLKTLAAAELETNGEYRESIHDSIFERFGATGLDPMQLAKLPDYLVCTNISNLDAVEVAEIMELLAAGLPVKVLVETDDVLEPSPFTGAHLALSARSRQLVDASIGLNDVFVLQSAASNLFRLRDPIIQGLEYGGPALFSVFSGTSGHSGSVPPYLIAAAATESRMFPSLVYDPSAGPEWATKLDISSNPQVEADWPTQTFEFEDEKLQVQAEQTAFTPADFMALDDRFWDRFAVASKTDWNDGMTPAWSLGESEFDGLPREVPYVLIVDEDHRLRRAIIDRTILQETRRCLKMWQSLQELGGINNSYVQRVLAKGYTSQEFAGSEIVGIAETLMTDLGASEMAEISLPDREDLNGDDPYIETPRCTSCNECTQVNSKMFAYNENKQAYIADPSAGTFRQLVEAAEGCQVSIIHPGKPRNPAEPGLEELLERASGFI